MPNAQELDALLAKAMSAHQAGRLAEAQSAYKAVLKAVPGHFPTLHFLGLSYFQAGKPDKGIEFIGRALKLKPDYAEAHYNLATALHGLGRTEEASGHYRSALAADPNNPDAHNNLGAILLVQKRADEAISHFERALAINPGSALTHSNLGAAFKELRRYDQAVVHLERALSISPTANAEIHCNLGGALLELERNADALKAFDVALSLAPGQADAHLGRGNALAKLGRPDEALAAFDQALARDGALAEGWLGRANVLKDINEREQAMAAYDRALSLDPSLASAWLGRGNVWNDLNANDKALEAYGEALKLAPDLAEAAMSQAGVYEKLARYEEAAAAFDRAYGQKPYIPYLQGHRLFAKLLNCDWSGYEGDLSHLLADVRRGEPAATPFNLLALSSSVEELKTCAEQAVRRQYPAAKTPLWRGERYDHDRIRVAYLSADMREHAIPRLAAGLFEHHDRTRFETIAVSFGQDDGSAMRARLTKAFDRFIDVRQKPDGEIAQLVRDLEIDIAVDLMGFTRGARLGVFARRPAPVQVNYLCYTGTIGADYMDYIVADRTVLPEDHRGAYAEQVVYLPHCYQSQDDKRDIAETTPTREAAGLPASGFVFCCFNNSYKITPPFFDVWMRLLKAVEGSVLWLLEGSASSTENLKREAQARGVAPERLVVAPRMAVKDHLARQRLADLFLDTLPYNAHTTGGEALWAGLPILTLLGSSFSGRVGASLLTAVGLPEQITHSLQDYEQRALLLARDPALLAALKAKLAENRTTQPLFDTKRSARDLEALYAAMWRRHQQGLPPHSSLQSD